MPQSFGAPKLWCVMRKQIRLHVFSAPHLSSHGNNVSGQREKLRGYRERGEGGSKKRLEGEKEKEKNEEGEREYPGEGREKGRREATGTQSHWGSGVCQKDWKLGGGVRIGIKRGFSGRLVLQCLI